MPVADDTVKTLNPLAHSRRALLRISLLVEGGMFVAALVIGLLAGVPLWEGARVGWSSVSLGVAAGLALLAAAATITESNLPFAVQMRSDIDRLLILFRGATLADFLVISILAGLGEEATTHEALGAIFMRKTAAEWEAWGNERDIPLVAIS